MHCQRLARFAFAVLVAQVAVSAPPQDILRSPDTVAATSYRFSSEDEALLDPIQHGCFLYLWNEVGRPAELVKDRLKADVSSVAAVGFQLSALPIGVERGWITRQQGADRATRILTALRQRTDNKKFGVYLHFVDHHTGGLKPDSPQVQASTVDHALLLAGALPSAVYFGDEVAQQVDQLERETNWSAYVNEDEPAGYISFGWRPEDPSRMDGPGGFRPWKWYRSNDEELLVYFLAVGASQPEHGVEPEWYYRLQRPIKQHGDMPPHVVSWNGALFTYFFSHCWIDYRHIEADRPELFEIDSPRVDWFENSRRAVLTHRQRCVEASGQYRTLSENRWGLSPCTGKNAAGDDSYLVPSVRPNVEDKDEWCLGTVAPYAAGSAIMFTPQESMAALRELRHLRNRAGNLLAWSDPNEGGYGLADSFNLDQDDASDDHVGIDVGPLLLAIENARTGLIWRLFGQHDLTHRSLARLKLVRTEAP